MITSMLEAALRALLVAAAVGAGLWLLRMGNVLAQKAAWGLVLAAALAMPLLLPLAQRSHWLPAATVALPAHWNLSADPKPAPEQMLSEIAPESAPDIAAAPKFDHTTRSMPAPRLESRRDRFASGPADTASGAAMSAGSSTTGSTIETSPPMERHGARGAVSWLPAPAAVAGMIYLAVCLALLMRLVYGLAAAFCIWRAAEPVNQGQPDGLPVRSSRAVSSPVTIGSGVVLPDDFDQWDAEKLRIVLAHERSHIRQGDFYLQLVAGLYAAIFWFSPLGWWLKRKLSELGEAISDRAALDEAASRSSYAQLLLEFAALPRPTLIGVAMARTSSISHRIERLLNDASFRKAFAGSRRALLAVLLVPVALFAATALIHVQAAEAARPVAAAQATPPAPAAAPEAAQAAIAGQSNPDRAPAEAPDPAVAPIPPAPSADQAPAVAPVPAAPAAPLADVAPEPPAPLEPPEQDNDTVTNTRGRHGVTSRGSGSGSGNGHGHGFGFSYSSNGDSYALVTNSDQHMNFSGDQNGITAATLDKARTQAAHGKFLLFKRDGKSYLIDDESIVDGIEAMYKPMDELGRQQEELGRQQEKLGKEQERLGHMQEQASVPAPDLSKELAELNAAIAKLQAKKGGAMTQDDLGELQGKIGDLEGKIGELEGKIGDAQGKLGDQQGRLGDAQGKLGEQQGKLGEQQGRIAEEADRKIKGIIDESLQNGKARPVQ